jgi:hypothetical protein
MTANNIRVRLHRGRAALRSRLRALCGPCMDARCLDCHCDPGRVARGLTKRASRGRAL